MTPVPTPALIGVVTLCASLGVLALVAIYASMPSPRRAMTPPPDRPGIRYSCYCWQRPVRVLIVEPEPEPEQQPVAARRGRHAKGNTDHRAHPHASPAAAGSGGRGKVPVPAAA
ncbi:MULTISPECIES: hypothetical protein [unclassified Streptomyces]|uniref:hypothetical protein n=1 Tax=unclassified Streptomyces TaxID=2593676 RepID=UPI0006B01792|nr:MULTISPECIES: hypothetical protein [unclassified Streptomyces]KOX33059.1 hypothetical protein ADL06_10005 [Streptomyces sp. NRRL F-6491]KOX36228.1 hypothetical protein ADL08_33000 [Streptomyces sp. NRRL F-6492]